MVRINNTAITGNRFFGTKSNNYLSSNVTPSTFYTKTKTSVFITIPLKKMSFYMHHYFADFPTVFLSSVIH